MSAPFSRALAVAPGQPEIVVQDAFDLETPARIIVSNSGQYRVQVYETRYRIYDTATVAKLDSKLHAPQ
jgi:hypothetical protein